MKGKTILQILVIPAVLWMALPCFALNFDPISSFGNFEQDLEEENAPNPTEVFIKGLNFAGTGCPAGSVSSLASPDGKAFTLIFDKYVAEGGPTVNPSKNRRNCQIAVDMRFPQGWSFTIFEVDYRGYAKIDAGATGIQKTAYYFTGQAATASLSSTFRGPIEKDYHERDTLGITALVWSPCGLTRALNLNSQIRVSTSGSQKALMTIDSIDGQVSHKYGVQWKRCKAT